MPHINLKFGKRVLSLGVGGGRGLYLKMGALPMGSNFNGSTRFGNGRSWFFGLLPGADVDYQRQAGEPWKNGIISAALSWFSRNLPFAPLQVWRKDARGQAEIVIDHPLAERLKYPNKFYDGKVLLQATYLSLIAGRGNAYWWVKRANNGQPLEFWYLPHFDCWPLWSNESTTDNWITGYGYRQNGIDYFLNNDEVIHFRDGLDPEQPRLGFDSLRAGSREIVVDNEAASYAAQLLQNMCIPGALLSPDGDGQFEQGDFEEIKNHFEDATTAFNRFRPVVLSGSVKVDKLSFTPSEMQLDTIQDRPEARLLSMIGLSPMVLDLTVGLAHSTYSNKESAEKAAWHNAVMPRNMLIASTLDTQVLWMYPEGKGMFLAADYRKVPALQDDLDAKYKRLSEAVGGPFLTPDEARQELGLLPVAEGAGAKLYPPKGMGQPGDGSQDGGSGAGDQETKMLSARRLLESAG